MCSKEGKQEELFGKSEVHERSVNIPIKLKKKASSMPDWSINAALINLSKSALVTYRHSQISSQLYKIKL